MILYSPDEILAMRAERGLLEEARNEAMIFDIIDVLLLERSFSAAVPHAELILDLGHLVQGVVLVGHDDGFAFALASFKHSRNTNYLKKNALVACIHTRKNYIVFYAIFSNIFFFFVFLLYPFYCS